MFRLIAPALFLAVLAGCAPAQRTVDPRVAEPIFRADKDAVIRGATCNAESVSGLIGRTEEELMATQILGPVRTLRPGQAVTMDFLENRLNIVLDEQGVVTRLFCG